ncbi:MAG: hypothetical protein HRT67_10515 [Flavobacteriaceae bacterium]|nr:hypothetical protein [Flavobacteriaceae bacterium]
MKLILALILTTCLFVSCQKTQDPFEISKQHIGSLTDSTQVKDLKMVFINDSIHRFESTNTFGTNASDIEIYDSGGKQLLVLTPSQKSDSTATIKSIKVVDARFKTSKGLNAHSTFKDIKANYTISGIQNTLRHIIVSVNEINAYFTIEKTELPSELRFDMTVKIEALQIPDNAQIKNFFVQWL